MSSNPTRRIIAPSFTKDANGAYIKEPLAPEAEAPITKPGSLDDILERQMLALDRVTRQLTLASSGGSMTKDEIQSLATCMKLTMELKTKERQLLEGLSDEELVKLASKQ